MFKPGSTPVVKIIDVLPAITLCLSGKLHFFPHLKFLWFMYCFSAHASNIGINSTL